jgi:hypothetical protein
MSEEKEIAAVDLLRRIVKQFGGQYIESECPNAMPCETCRLMTEARKFVDAIPLAPAQECATMRGDG